MKSSIFNLPIWHSRWVKVPQDLVDDLRKKFSASAFFFGWTRLISKPMPKSKKMIISVSTFYELQLRAFMQNFIPILVA
jgi:hypothetical protein